MAEKNEIINKQFVGYAYFAMVHKPRVEKPESDYKTRYKLDLRLENEDGSPIVVTNKAGEKINMFELANEYKIGVKDANDSIPGAYAEFKRKLKTDANKNILMDESGEPVTKPVEVVDRNNNPISAKTLIGNGSKVVVQTALIPYEAKLERPVMKDGSVVLNKDGTPKMEKHVEVRHMAYLHGVKVLDLVSYEGSFEEDEFSFQEDETSAEEVQESPFDSDEYDDEVVDA